MNEHHSHHSSQPASVIRKPEKAVLVGLKLPHQALDDLTESMEELRDLASTAGAEVLDMVVQSRSEIDARYYIGKGKIHEIRDFYADEKIDLLIFNHDLSPAQVRNVEQEIPARVLTRTELILDIFAIHARSRTAALQVELAQMQYQFPRLTGRGHQMSQIEGGIGMRGPGEQKLETDRRYLRRRMHLIKEKLKKIETVKETQRKKRGGEFKIAIVGYTNAGKSTLMNRLVKAEVLVEDKLFATLDTTTRKLWLGDGVQVVITDTVGFIRDLPHSLVESFKSTLEDTLNADLLLHVVDISAHNFTDKVKVVEETVSEIGGETIPMLKTLNKSDMVDTETLLRARMAYPEAVVISAKDNKNIDILKDKIREFVKNSGGIFTDDEGEKK